MDREKLDQVITDYILPELAKHNGAIEVQEYTGDSLTYRLVGQCATCVLAQGTTTEFIKNQIQQEMPEIKDIKGVGGVSPDLIAQARQILKERKNSR